MPVIYMEKASVDAMTEEKIRKIIDENGIDTKYQRLQDYYVGKHRILGEYKKDSTSPNNRLVNNLAKYITDTATGYFIGRPVIYNATDDAYLEKLQDILDYNDEQDHNAELAKRCSIDGNCFEMLYLDENARIRFAKVPAAMGIVIYETDSGQREPVAFIRKILSKDSQNNTVLKVEYWTATHVMRFVSVNHARLDLVAVEEHYWQDVPIVEYVNNEERIGDFEGVITEIDAYNKAQSNTANYFQYNDDAIMKITKLGDVSSEDVKDMKELGAIILEDGGDVGWLLKTIDDTALENYKSRLQEDIHLLSSVPKLSDEAFGSNLSGVAIAYKLWGLEQICAIKERKFKRGLQRRIELITNILNIQGGDYDYRNITPKFRRNRPQNDLEIAQIVTMLSGDLSRETRLQLIPSVENVQEEIARLEEEKNREKEDFGVYQNFAQAFRSVEETEYESSAAE